MTRTFSLDVLGLPAGKGSLTRMPNGAYLSGGPSAGARAKAKAWATAVAETARDKAADAGWQTCTGPVGLTMRFRMPVVASDPCRGRHVASPDLDKLARNVCDSLVVAGVIADDRLVFALNVSKWHSTDGSSGCGIDVVDWTEAESAQRSERMAAAAIQRRAAKAAAKASAS